jgi:hypothetical protein
VVFVFFVFGEPYFGYFRVVLERGEVGEVRDVVLVGYEVDFDEFGGVGVGQIDGALDVGDF